MRIKEVIVVEGRDDTANIKRAIAADTIETNGSALNNTILEQIRHAQAKRGVIVFTDPDYPGQRIRSLIDEAVPGCKHAFIERDEARSTRHSKASLGIEHASPEAIKQALDAVYERQPEYTSDISREDLVMHGLIGGKEAAKRRERLGSLLKIGHTNGKQLLKRLTMFQITKSELDAAMTAITQEEHTDES
ncbi:Ribonuclease M5 [Lentibacillus sp. JNUCC-1]|uniref:ribonuclease M5 n=1 Tax=Lentibacillus sp. JNUCC-1 TaxID=2654513 RepID=UPI001327CC09|nr:Ribonuclease M5 [Lentibacillus sp. JNUCC-1]